jgi:hypothetical protein
MNMAATGRADLESTRQKDKLETGLAELAGHVSGSRDGLDCGGCPTGKSLVVLLFVCQCLSSVIVVVAARPD